ncbi:unnamed protein product, partial [Discosporangium mesarthrocarpum]
KKKTKKKKKVGRRRLRNTCLSYLHEPRDKGAAKLCLEQFLDACGPRGCMTDKLAAVSCLVDIPGPEQDEALERFYKDADGDALVLNKWFAIQVRGRVINPVLLQGND